MKSEKQRTLLNQHNVFEFPHVEGQQNFKNLIKSAELLTRKLVHFYGNVISRLINLIEVTLFRNENIWT